ncbi:MAG: hypothetical protein ACE15C_18560 [Phycisphaerae bacterium]
MRAIAVLFLIGLLLLCGAAVAQRPASQPALFPPGDLSNMPPDIQEMMKAIQKKAAELTNKYADQGLGADEVRRRVLQELQPDIEAIQRARSARTQPAGAATSPATIGFDTLLRHIKGGATPQQMAVMEQFGKQKDSPAAIGELLKLLRQADPVLDNNACLALTYILISHPDADCPLDELLTAVRRRNWTSQQKAAQALAFALKPANWKGREEEIYRSLIPLLTSQRSRVYDAALVCLRKVSGKDLGPDADAWKAFYEQAFPGRKLDLSTAMYEYVVVVKMTGEAKDKPVVEGEQIADLKRLSEKLKALAAQAKARKLDVAVVIQVPDAVMTRIAQTGDYGSMKDAIITAAQVTGGQFTVSPESDVFRKPYKPGAPEAASAPAASRPK